MQTFKEKYKDQVELLQKLGLTEEQAIHMMSVIHTNGQVQGRLDRDNNTGWYTDLQIRDLLTAVQVYANANGKNGLIDVAGENYDQRAETMLKAFISSKSTTETVSKFRVPLAEYELS